MSIRIQEENCGPNHHRTHYCNEVAKADGDTAHQRHADSILNLCRIDQTATKQQLPKTSQRKIEAKSGVPHQAEVKTKAKQGENQHTQKHSSRSFPKQEEA